MTPRRCCRISGVLQAIGHARVVPVWVGQAGRLPQGAAGPTRPDVPTDVPGRLALTDA